MICGVVATSISGCDVCTARIKYDVKDLKYIKLFQKIILKNGLSHHILF